MRNISWVLLITVSTLFSQANVWTQLPQDSQTRAGCKLWSSLIYSSDSNRFFSTMGLVNNGSWDPPSRYSDLVLRLPDTRWINFLPSDTLYGKWADSTGNTLSTAGRNFESPHFKMVEGYLRPAVYFSTHKTFYQYAYDTDNQCIYYYLWNRTIRFNTRLRKWDTLTTAAQPATYQGGTSALIWGSLCYDPINKEILLFGGGDINAPGGSCGTWVYRISTNTWTKLVFSVEPPQRCLSQMVYDAKNHCIILFGGDHLDKIFSDTWVYDCATRTWSEKKPALSPSPRAGHALLYLPKSQSVVLFGGYTYKPMNVADGPSWYTGYKARDTLDMWRYDVAANEWKLIKQFSPTAVKPSWTFLSIAAADTGDRILVIGDSTMYGGYIKNTYVMTCDPTQIDEAGTFMHGVTQGALDRRTGAGDPAWFDSAVAAPRPDSLNDLYRTMPVNTWIRMTQPRMPYAGRDWSSRTFDADHDQLLLYGGGHSAYCGTDIPQYSPATNRWHIGYAPEFMIELNGDGGNGGNYTSLFTFQDRPFMPGHPRKAYCYSPVHKRMVSFNYGPLTYFYDPVRMDWDSTRRIRPDAANAGSTTTSCLVATPHGVFFWKGVNPSPRALYLLDSALVWQTLTVKGGLTIPIYYDGSSNATYDPKRDRMLLFSSQSSRGQVWEFTFKDSTLSVLNPSGDCDTTQTFWREAAYLPAQDKVFFMGTGTHRLYNCAANTWELLPVAKAAGVSTTCSWSSGYVYDPKRDLIWDCEQSGELNVVRISDGYNPDSLLASKEDAHSLVPDVMSLAIYPSPFNPSTTVTYTIPAAAKSAGVTLSVFAADGRLVQTLVRNQSKAGSHSVVWNAGKLPSGVYLLKLKADAKTLLRKVVLAK